MTTHAIRIHPSGGDKYRVTGACDIFDSVSPIPDSARALIAAGASPSDELRVTGDFTFAPTTLGAILKPRQKLRQSDIREFLGVNRH